MQNWEGKKVSVIGGLGIEGQDLVRYFARHGARVTVSDRRPLEAVKDRVDALMNSLPGVANLSFDLGSNDPSSVDGADLVCVSQGGPMSNPAVAAAVERGIPVTSMTKLFLDNYPGTVLGITGSSGKTTTT